jgi:hypothetical protein
MFSDLALDQEKSVGTSLVMAMDFVTHSHKFADVILGTEPYREQYEELVSIVHGVSDGDIIQEFQAGSEKKSISAAINRLLKQGFVEAGWMPEAPIFQASDYKSKKWRLDFAKDRISVEVAFNHGEAIPWNLLKPVLASLQNHVQKAIETQVGVVICATEGMKRAGNFDNAVGEFEKFQRFFVPLQDVLNAPILLIGLQAPTTFHVRGVEDGRRVIGQIERLP